MCQRRWYYHYMMELEPKDTPTRLSRGNIGHKALEILYKAKLNGDTVNQALEKATNYLLNLSIDLLKLESTSQYTVEQVAMIGDLIPLITKYVRYYWDNDPLEPIEVETVHKIPITSEVTYAMRLDLLAKYTQYPYKGDLIIVDWKFWYNFPTPDLLELNPQLAKYVWGISAEGNLVTKGMLDILRYRSLTDPDPSKIFDRKILRPRPAARKKIIEDHTKTALEIREIKLLPVVEASKVVKRNLNTMACKYCPYTKLCIIELKDGNPTLEINTNFKASEYGYNDDESAII